MDPPPASPAPQKPLAKLEEVSDTPEIRRKKEIAEKNGLDYQVQETIGQGRKHKTEKWIDKESGEVVVAKSMSTLDIDGAEFARQAKEALALADHPATSKPLGFFPGSSASPAAFLTRMEAGTLAGLLASPERFNSTARARVLVGVAASLKYLHSKKYVHGGIKPTNIGIDQNGNPQVMLSVRMMASDSDLSWKAPELLNEGKLTEAADIYALGLLAYQLIADKPVFDPELKVYPLMQAIMGGQRPAVPEGVPPEIVDLITRAWDVDAAKRPTAAEFFDGLSVAGYKIKSDVDELAVRKYAARFVDGPQPGEAREAAETRIIQQTREQLEAQQVQISELNFRVKQLASENLELVRSGLAADRAIEAIAGKILSLERELFELKKERRDSV